MKFPRCFWQLPFLSFPCPISTSKHSCFDKNNSCVCPFLSIPTIFILEQAFIISHPVRSWALCLIQSSTPKYHLNLILLDFLVLCHYLFKTLQRLPITQSKNPPQSKLSTSWPHLSVWSSLIHYMNPCWSQAAPSLSPEHYMHFPTSLLFSLNWVIQILLMLMDSGQILPSPYTFLTFEVPLSSLLLLPFLAASLHFSISFIINLTCFVPFVT